MLNPASCMNRWSDGRGVRRAIALPFVGVLVGLFLTATSASSRASRPLHPRDLAASVESTAPMFAGADALLHSPPAFLDTQRRGAPISSDLLSADTPASIRRFRSTIAFAAPSAVRRASQRARGYDATAPPFRFV
jgi:hypothetical protein